MWACFVTSIDLIILGCLLKQYDKEKRHHYRNALPATVSSRFKVVFLSCEVFGHLGKPTTYGPAIHSIG